MIFKWIAGVLGAVLLVGYMAPVVWRLQDTALWIVAMTGVVMMLVDLRQSLQSKED